MLKVLILSPDADDGCTWYRLKQFAKKAGELQLADVHFVNPKLPDDQLMAVFRSADIFVARLNTASMALMDIVHQYNKPLIIDIDDSYRFIDPLSDMYQVYGTQEVELKDGTMLWKDGEGGFKVAENEERVQKFENALKKATAVIVTTFELKAYANQFNDAVVVMPNAIEPSIFPHVSNLEKGKNEVRIVWAGGSTHYPDLAEVREPLTAIVNDYPNVHFHILGVPFEGIIKNMPKSRVHTYSWIKADGHGYRLASVDGDIGICPLQDMPFNYTKSSVKYYEYSACRMATVARNIPPYADDIVHDHTGLLYNTPEEFHKQLVELVQDPFKRLQLAQNAYEYTTQQRHLDDITHDWIEFLEGVVEAKTGMKGGQMPWKYYLQVAREVISEYDSPKVLKTDCNNEFEARPYRGGIAKNVDADMTLVEYEQEFIDKAKALYPDLNIVKGDIRELPFKDKEFDVVMDFSTLDHIPPKDLEKAIAEYARVADDLVLISWCSRDTDLLAKNKDENWDSTDQYYFNQEEIEALLKKYYTIEETDDTFYNLKTSYMVYHRCKCLGNTSKQKN